MELLTVFWVDAAGTWTLKKVFASKVRITHLSSYVAKGCYGLSHPWVLRQCKSPKWDPIYTILYDGSHIPPLLPFHLKITSPTVKWITTTQIKTQGHLIYTCAMVNCDSHQRLLRGWPQLWEAAGDFCSLCLLWHRRTCWGHARASVACAAGHVLSPDPTVSQKTTHGPNSTLDQDFPSPSCISIMLFILLSSPAHHPSSPPIPHALFHYWPMGWNELHISSWKHGCLRAAWRKKITQIIGTTAPQYIVRTKQLADRKNQTFK